MFGLVRQKMAQARGKFRTYQQKTTSMKAASLEEKAEHAKKLRKDLERQKKARGEIEKTKELKREQVRSRVQGLKEGLKKIKSNLPKPKKKDLFGSPGSGPEFGLGSGKSSPFDIKVKK